jgi:hypothetical protein
VESTNQRTDNMTSESVSWTRVVAFAVVGVVLLGAYVFARVSYADDWCSTVTVERAVNKSSASTPPTSVDLIVVEKTTTTTCGGGPNNAYDLGVLAVVALLVLFGPYVSKISYKGGSIELPAQRKVERGIEQASGRPSRSVLERLRSRFRKRDRPADVVPRTARSDLTDLTTLARDYGVDAPGGDAEMGRPAGADDHGSPTDR